MSSYLIFTGQLRVLKVDQTDDDENGNPRITPAGSIIEIIDIWKTGGTYQFSMGCPATGANWFFDREELLRESSTPPMPENPFKDSLTFRLSLQVDKEKTIRQFMERKVDELMQDGIRDVVGCLTKWAMDGVNLGSDKEIVGLAEGLFDS